MTRRYFHCCRHCGFTPAEGMDAYLELHGDEAVCLGGALMPIGRPAFAKCATVFDYRERAVHALMQCMEAGHHDEVVHRASTSPDCQLGHADARKAAGCTWLSFWDIDARLYVSATSDRRSLWLADSERIYRLAHDVGTGAVDAVV